jgi:TfoX/Sxy family transcriptional regulator of competence genes
MSYDEGLVQRIRELLEDDPRISEKKMFGGVAFFVNGNMAAGTMKHELMVRVGPVAHDDALAQPHARPMEFTRRPMRGFVQVAPAGFEEDADLRAWLERGIAHAAAQPPKSAGAATRRAAKAKPRVAKPAVPKRRKPSARTPRKR